MATRRTTAGKMQRDRAKKARATAKQERRQERLAASETGEPAEDAPGGRVRVSEAEIIDRLTALHQRFEAGTVGFDDFEEEKAALLAHLSVD